MKSLSANTLMRFSAKERAKTTKGFGAAMRCQNTLRSKSAVRISESRSYTIYIYLPLKPGKGERTDVHLSFIVAGGIIMSKKRALDLINFKKTDICPYWESIDHPEWVLSRQKSNETFRDTYLRLMDEYEIDFTLRIPEDSGKQMGCVPEPIPVMTEEDIYRFDPFKPPSGHRIDYVEALGVPPSASIDEMADHFKNTLEKKQQTALETALVPGAHWHQIFHYFATTFGYEPVSVAAYMNPELFRESALKFAELTKKVHEAWVAAGAPFMYCHDDLAMVDRTIFPPDWYRETIYPLYDIIWEPLRKASMPFFFVSDGKTDELLPEIAKLGPSGFFLDDMVDLDRVADLLGENHILLGNIKISTITFGTKEEIDAEIKRCLDARKKCPWLCLNCSGKVMSNIPLENVDYYMDRVLELRKNQECVILPD
ncbi:MAG: hypothetical protein GF344_08640 [Chitinivibrionales bacterium]|nr:hypothetical protein [Chitinivibrionales bacterium]MBD3356941.1 hypothetical protein [Chitinivibrionales bacterium]